MATTNTNDDQRRGVLKMYLLMLATKANTTGGFSGVGDDRVEAVAAALANGSRALLDVLWNDVKVLAGEGSTVAQSFLGGLAERVARQGIDRGIDFVADAVSGRRAKDAARRDVGKQFMDAAQRMGGRR